MLPGKLGGEQYLMYVRICRGHGHFLRIHRLASSHPFAIKTENETLLKDDRTAVYEDPDSYGFTSLVDLNCRVLGVGGHPRPVLDIDGHLSRSTTVDQNHPRSTSA